MSSLAADLLRTMQNLLLLVNDVKDDVISDRPVDSEVLPPGE